MNSLRACLALALFLLPGLQPAASAAGPVASGARVAPGAVTVPALGVSMPRLSPPGILAAGGNPGVAGLPSLSKVVPAITAPGAAASVAGAPASAAPAGEPARVDSPSPAAALAAAAAASRADDNLSSASEIRPAAAAVSARFQLGRGAARIAGASAPGASVESGRAALDRVFSGTAELGDTDVPGAVTHAPQRWLGGFLERPSGPPAGGGSQRPEPSAPQGPRQSLARSARVGLIAAIVPIALTYGTLAVATALGYHAHPGYQDPFPAHMTAVAAVGYFIAAAVMAPVSEEMIFRQGLMGWLTKVMPAGFGQAARFLLPAAASSVVFVAAHELSDPVLFATRFVHAMILSYVFHKEGLTGSMFAHGFFNGLLFLPMLLTILLPGAAGTVAAGLLAPAALYAGWRAFKALRAQRDDKKSGRLIAYVLSSRQALALMAALLAGFFFLPNPVWIVGAFGWLFYALKRRASTGGR